MHLRSQRPEFPLKTESKNLVMAKITDYQRIASSYDVMKKHHRAAETLLTGLNEANKYAKENSSQKGPLVYRALVNWYSHGMLYPKSHKDLSKSLVVEMMEDARES